MDRFNITTMPKFFLPLGLTAGAIAVITFVTPNLFSIPPKPLVQAQQTSLESQPMTQQELERILGDISEEVEVNQNQVLFKFEDQSMLLVTDAEADRMRIILPIAKVDDITAEDMAKMMIANFHTALDGRYAIGNGIVYSAFIHPLSSLHADDFRAAVVQVSSLAKTFGSTYTSGSSLFGAPLEDSETSDELPAI